MNLEFVEVWVGPSSLGEHQGTILKEMVPLCMKSGNAQSLCN